MAEMKSKGQVLIWLDNKQLNGHWETVWVTHLVFDLRRWMEDKNKQQVLTQTEQKENMALKV